MNYYDGSYTLLEFNGEIFEGCSDPHISPVQTTGMRENPKVSHRQYTFQGWASLSPLNQYLIDADGSQSAVRKLIPWVLARCLL